MCNIINAGFADSVMNNDIECRITESDKLWKTEFNV